MIEDIATWIGKWQAKKPAIFLILFALLTVALAPGMLRLVDHVEPSLEKVLPQDIAEVKTMNEMRAQFGADMMYLVITLDGPVTDVRDPKMIKYMDTLGQRLDTHENIKEVSSLADIVKQRNDGFVPDSLTRIKAIFHDSPQANRFMNADYSLAIIHVRSDTGSSAKVIKRVVEDIKQDIQDLEQINPGAHIEITGFNAIDKATFEVIMQDFASITIVSMILVSIVVLITFRSVKRGFLPMIVVMAALVWTMGIVGYLGFTITVVSMVAAAMLMGLGIDFGIHVVHRYYHLRETNTKQYAFEETLRQLWRPMLAASLTTIAGFMALLFGVLPAMKTLGMVLGIGITATLIGGVLLLPAIVSALDNDR